MKDSTRNRVISFRVTSETYERIERTVKAHNERWRTWCQKNSTLPPWDLSVADFAMAQLLTAVEKELGKPQK